MNLRNTKGQFEKKSVIRERCDGTETAATSQVSLPRDTLTTHPHSNGRRKLGGKSKALRISTIMALICTIGIIISCLGLGDPWKSVGIITAIGCGITFLVALALALSACVRCGALMPDSTDIVIDRRSREATGYTTEVVATHYDKDGKYAGESRRRVPYNFTVVEVKKRTDYHCKSCGYKWSRIGQWRLA